MILIISNEGFHPGFKLFNLKDSIQLRDKNNWIKLPVSRRIRIALQYKTIHYFWGRVNFWEVLVLLLLKRNIILHFIGSDVLMILKSRSKQLKTKLYKLLGANLLVVHNNLKQELEEVGITAKVVEFVNRKIVDLKEVVPGKFSVLAYVPEGKEKFYNFKIIEETAKIHKEITFNIFPYSNSLKLHNMNSIKPVEHEKVIELINKHILFIRIPKHDGLPNTIIEALMCSRYVVWSYDHPFVFKAKTVNELSKIITQVKEKNQLNYEGKNYVLDNYNIQSIKNKFTELWQLT